MKRRNKYTEKRKGIVTPYGQWKYPGMVTTIPSSDITMKGVDYPVFGISDKGDTKLMMPGNDYKFNGTEVTEYPAIGKYLEGNIVNGPLMRKQQPVDYDVYNGDIAQIVGAGIGALAPIAMALWNKYGKSTNENENDIDVNERFDNLLQDNMYWNVKEFNGIHPLNLSQSSISAPFHYSYENKQDDVKHEIATIPESKTVSNVNNTFDTGINIKPLIPKLSISLPVIPQKAFSIPKWNKRVNKSYSPVLMPNVEENYQKGGTPYEIPYANYSMVRQIYVPNKNGKYLSLTTNEEFNTEDEAIAADYDYNIQHGWNPKLTNEELNNYIFNMGAYNVAANSSYNCANPVSGYPDGNLSCANTAYRGSFADFLRKKGTSVGFTQRQISRLLPDLNQAYTNSYLTQPLYKKRNIKSSDNLEEVLQPGDLILKGRNNKGNYHMLLSGRGFVDRDNVITTNESHGRSRHENEILYNKRIDDMKSRQLNIENNREWGRDSLTHTKEGYNKPVRLRPSGWIDVMFPNGIKTKEDFIKFRKIYNAYNRYARDIYLQNNKVPQDMEFIPVAANNIAEQGNKSQFGKYLAGNYVNNVMSQWNNMLAQSISKGDSVANMVGSGLNAIADMTGTIGNIVGKEKGLQDWMTKTKEQSGRNPSTIAEIERGEVISTPNGMSIANPMANYHELYTNTNENNGTRVQLSNDVNSDVAKNPALSRRSNRVNKYTAMRRNGRSFIFPSTVGMSGLLEPKKGVEYPMAEAINGSKVQSGGFLDKIRAIVQGRAKDPVHEFATKKIISPNEEKTFSFYNNNGFGGAGAGSTFKLNNSLSVDGDKILYIPVGGRSFTEAFAEARKKGLSEFIFNGKKYTTEMSDNPKYTQKEYENPSTIKIVKDYEGNVYPDSTKVFPFPVIYGEYNREDDPNIVLNKFLKGGPIHIKPSKRGTFTAAATNHGMGVQEFARKVLANKDNYSSAMVKKANFARNASHWKHQDGGNTDPREAYMQSSYRSWYDTLTNNGIDKNKAYNLAWYLALQDAKESSYGTSRFAKEYNNHGGMLIGGKAVRYKDYNHYLNTKFNDIKTKYTALLDMDINSIDDFYKAINANPNYQYAPADVNPSYLNDLKNMKSAQKWLNKYRDSFFDNTYNVDNMYPVINSLQLGGIMGFHKKRNLK